MSYENQLGSQTVSKNVFVSDIQSQFIRDIKHYYKQLELFSSHITRTVVTDEATQANV